MLGIPISEFPLDFLFLYQLFIFTKAVGGMTSKPFYVVKKI